MMNEIVQGENEVVQETNEVEANEQNYLEWLKSTYEDGNIRVQAYNIAKNHFGPNAFNLYVTNGYVNYKRWLQAKINEKLVS